MPKLNCEIKKASVRSSPRLRRAHLRTNRVSFRRVQGGIRWECRRLRLEQTLECESQRHLNLPRAADGVDRLSQTGRALIEEITDEWISAVSRTRGRRGHWTVRYSTVCLGRSRVERKILTHIVDGDVEACMVCQVVDVQAVLQRKSLR